MLHDTFCTPSTFDMNNSNNKNSSTTDNNDKHDHVNANTNFATPLEFDTLNSPISPQPRSSNSTLTTSSTSSYDESTNVDDQKLILWIQRQLEFYTILSIIPRFSSIDDLGHGKLLLCLIHRISPVSLPSLVTTLNQKTSIECLLLADDLAQQLWDTTIDSLPSYLYHHHHHQQQQQSQQDTIGDFVDQLIIPSSFTSTKQLDSLSDNIIGEEDAQLPAAATLPIWQPLTNDVDMNVPSLTRCWIETTHHSIHDHLQHPRTKRLYSHLTLLEQLQHVYVDFTQLASMGNDDLIQSAEQLNNRLEQMNEHVITLRGMTATGDDGGGGDDDTYLVDVLIQRHMCLQSWVRSALCLYQQSSKVQNWVHEQKAWMVKHGVTANWMDAVLQYQQENRDVKALTEFCRSSSNENNKRVAHVTIGTVILALDGLDSLISNAKQISDHDLAWQKGLTRWQAVYTRSLAELGTLDDSVLALAHQAKWNPDEHQQSTSFLQQWKILSRRVAHQNTIGAPDGYAAVISLYQQLESSAIGCASSTSRMEALDRDYAVYIQKWKQLELDLHMSRQIITQRKRIEDFLHQCHLVQLKTSELEEQLDGCANLYLKTWMEDQVEELDAEISRVLVLANDLMTTIGDDTMANLTQYWKQALDQCKSGCHQAWVRYQSKCTRLERHRELETIKQVMAAQLDTMVSGMIDPWTCALDDLDGMKHDCAGRKRQFMQMVVARFEQWIKDKDDDEEPDAVLKLSQDIHAGMEKVQQLLTDYESRLGTLEKRIAWEHQWTAASAWIKQTATSVHAMVDSRSNNARGSSLSSLDDIRQQVSEYKHNIELVQQAFDALIVDGNMSSPTAVLARMHQRQQLLGNQSNDLDGLLDSAYAVVGQTTIVNTYMSTVDEMNHASKSLGDRLDDALLSSEVITDQAVMDQEIQALESSAVQLWQHSGSQVPYPLSFLVVDDLVRWKVIAAYGEVLAALVHLVRDLDSWNKRASWEEQWQLDMDTLTQEQQHLSTYLQQFDVESSKDIMENEVNDAVATIQKYLEDPLQHLEQLFLNTQLAYPVNIKIPLPLEDQQQQLTLDVCGRVKTLCGLIKYLQAAKQMEDKCADMNATLDQKGADASEEQVQQWMDDTKIHVEQELFVPLCDQQAQLRDGVDVFGREKVEMVRDRASTMLEDLQARLATTLKESQHTRLVQAYRQSSSALESSLHQLQDDLISSANEHGKMVPGDGCDVYRQHEETLNAKWKEAKLTLETTHTASYNDVRCLCQLIQLQKDESDVATRQSQLDDLWKTVLQDLNGVHRLVLALTQWQDLSSSLDKVEKMLVPAYDSMDMSALKITTDLASVANVLPMIYQDAHTTLAALGGMVPSAESEVVLYDSHNRGVFTDRFDRLSTMVDGLLTALLQCTQQEATQQRDLILNRLTSLTQMPLFGRESDGDDMPLVQQWDDLVLNMGQGASKYGFIKKTMDSLMALCEDNVASPFTMCRDSVDNLHQAVVLEKHCSDTFLAKAVECGRQASKLLVCMDDFGKELGGLVMSSQQGVDGSKDWQLDLRLLEYRIGNFEKDDIQEFMSKSQERLVSADGEVDMTSDVVNEVDQHVKDDIQALVNQVEVRWNEIKAQLTEATQSLLKHMAEQQWQAFLTLVDNACDRASDLLVGLDHIGNKNGSVTSAGSSSSVDDDEDDDETMVHMMGQEQDLMAAEQSMTILDYEMRPLLKSKAVEMKASLDTLADPWIGHVDVDNALEKWEQMLQKHKQRLHHGMTLCQYWAAAAEVHGYLFAMEQVVDKNNPEVLVASSGFMMVDGHAIAVELETKHKVYSDALTLSLEKARQVATLVDLGQTDYPNLVTKRNKLEQRYNDRMKEWLHWIGSTNGNTNSTSSNSSGSSGSNGSTNSARLSGLRSRKISLPSKMPSPPPPHASSTASTRRRVASSTSSSSSPLLQAQRKLIGRKPSFNNANSMLRPPPPAVSPTPAPAPNAYVADPKNDLDMEIGRIVNKVPYKVELQMVPGSAGRYRFGDKVVYCRILKSHMVMVRVGGGWTELSQFLRDHALVGHGSGFMMQKSSMENCQEAFLETKRATSPTSGRPLPRMSQSTSTSSSISGNAGYKDGDRYIAVDMQGQQHEMKMTPHDSTSSRRR